MRLFSDSLEFCVYPSRHFEQLGVCKVFEYRLDHIQNSFGNVISVFVGVSCSLSFRFFIYGHFCVRWVVVG